MPTRKRNPLRKIRRTRAGDRFRKPGGARQTVSPGRGGTLRRGEMRPDPGDIFVERRTGVRFGRNERAELEKRAVSRDKVKGTIWERIFYLALVKRQIPFDFQSGFEGGRLELGGLVADFVLLDRPLIVQIHGSFWHEGVHSRARDEQQNDLLRAYGFDVEELWDYTIRLEPVFNEWMRRHIDTARIGTVPDIVGQFRGNRRY